MSKNNKDGVSIQPDKSRQLSRSRMLALEPRVLLDAAGLVTAVDSISASGADVLDIQSTQNTQNESEVVDLFSEYVVPGAISASTVNEIIFVDSSFRDKQALESQQSSNSIFYQLDSNKSGIQQISDVLHGYDGIQSVKILTTGDAQGIHLGGQVITSDNISQYSDILNDWVASVDTDSTLLIQADGSGNYEQADLLNEKIGDLSSIKTQIIDSDNELIDSSAAGNTEIVFVDSRVKDADVLLAGVDPNAEIIYLSADSDGIAQIEAALEGRSNIGAIHILSHGDNGMLLLGNSVVNNDSLASYSTQLASIGSSLSTSGDILLYGCEVAGGESGQRFINRLAELTQADIAASTDTTGSAAENGDWILEAQTGKIDKNIAFSDEVIAVYQQTLITTTYTGFGNDISDWNDIENWSDAVPVSGDDVVIDGAFTVNFSSTISLNSLTLTNGATLNLNGTFAIAGLTTVDATSTISINGGSVDVGGSMTVNGDLGLNAGSITGVGDITVLTGGSFTFDGNSSIGGSVKLTTQTGVITTLADTKDASLSGTAIWNNVGQINWTGEANDNFNIDTTAVFNNQSGGVLTIAGNANSVNINGAGTFNNTGSILKTTVFDVNISTVFDNDGTVDVQAGELMIIGDHVNGDDGAYTVADNATLRFNSNTRTWNATSSITGTSLSTVLFDGNGTTNKVFVMAGNYNVAGTTRIAFSTITGTDTLDFTGTVINVGQVFTQSGATNLTFVTFGAGSVGAFSNVTNLDIQGGNLTLINGADLSSVATLNRAGGGILDIAGNDLLNLTSMTVNGGTLTGTGTITLGLSDTFIFGGNSKIDGSLILNTQTGSVTTLADTNDATLSGAVVWNNTGQVNWLGEANDNFNLNAITVFNNLAGGVFTIAGNANTISIAGTGTFNNAGSILKTTAFNTNISTLFENDGTVDVQAGELMIIGDHVNGDDGSYTVADNATLRFNSNTRTWSAASSITGTSLSTVLFDGNGTTNKVFVMAGNYNVAGTTRVAFSTITGTDTLDFTGTVTNVGQVFTQSGAANLSFVTFGAGSVGAFSNVTNLDIQGGNLTLINGADLSSVATLNRAGGGILDIAGNDLLNLTSLTVNGGTLTGTGIITLGLSDTFVFGGNSKIDGSLTLNTQTGSFTTLADTSDATLSGAVVWNNAGQVNWIGENADNFNLNATTVFNNLAGGVFTIAGTANTINVTGTGTFINAGSILKTTAFNTNIVVLLDNYGFIDVQAGILSLDGGGYNGGNISIAASSELQFSSTVYDLGKTTSLTGTGTVNFGNFVVFSDFWSVAKNTPSTVTVNSNLISVNTLSQPFDGAVVDNGNGLLTFTPLTNFLGSDQFTFTVLDSYANPATATISVLVTGVNDAPVAVDDTGIIVPVNTATIIDVLANDTDPNSESLSVLSVSTPTNGTVVINQGVITSVSGSVVQVFAPVSVASQTYESDTEIRVFQELTEYTLGTDLAVNITNAGTYTSTGSLTAGVIARDSVVSINYVNFDKVGASATAVALSGSVTFDADVLGIIVLSAELDASDSLSLSGTSYGTGTSLRGLELAANEFVTLSADKRTVSFTLNSGTVSDSIRIITAAEQITYTPNNGYVGPDSFTYTVLDGNDGTDTGLVSLNVDTVNPALWDGNSDGDGDNINWEDPQNWVGDVLPGTADAVVIDGATVTLSANVTQFITSIELRNSAVLNITGSGNLTFSGASSVDATSTLNLDNWMVVDGTLSVAGSMTFTKGGLAGTGVTTIESTGTLDIVGTALRRLTGTLDNFGKTTYNTDTDDFSIDNGVFNNKSGATFEIQNDIDIFRWRTTGQFNNEGTFSKTGGTGSGGIKDTSITFSNINGSYNATSGTLTIASSGNYTGTMTNIGTGAIEFATATHTFNAGSSLVGDFQWTSGIFAGAGSVATTGTLDITGTALRRLTGTLDNYGLVTYNTDTDDFSIDNGAFNNKTGATFEIQNDINIFRWQSGTTGQFNNEGTFSKTVGTGSGGIKDASITFYNNNGIVNSTSGTLDIASQGNYSGTITQTGAGVVRFSTNTHTFNTGSSLVGNFEWTSGIFAGTSSVAASSTLDLAGTALRRLTGTLDNFGLVTYTSDSNDFAIDNGVFNNKPGATFEIQNDISVFRWQSGTTGQFNNEGTFSKIAGTGSGGVVDSLITFDNINGILDIQSGTLFLQNAISSSNGFNLQGTGTINLNGSTAPILSVTPGGSPDALTITGNLSLDSASVVNVELGGLTAVTQYDVLNVTGNLVLDGILNLSQINGFSGTVGDSFNLFNYTGTFTNNGATIAGPGGFTYGLRDVGGTVVLDIVSLANSALWDGNSDNDGDNLNWNDPLNWVGDVLPGSGDSVVIDGATVTFNTTASIGSIELRNGATLNINSGALDTTTLSSIDASSTINISGGTFTANGDVSALGDISQSGGIINGIGTFTIGGDFNWSGGSQADTGTTDVNGMLNISGSAGVTLSSSRTLNANGGGSFAGTGVFLLNNATTFNTTAGVFNLIGDANIVGGLGTWNNSATITKTATSNGLTEISTAFNNNGVFNVDNGQLQFAGSGTQTGLFTGAGQMLFRYGTYNFNAGSNLAVADVTFNGGTTNFNTGSTYGASYIDLNIAVLTFNTGSSYDVSNITVSGGNLTLNVASTTSINTVTVNSGNFIANVNINVLSDLTLSGGNITGTGNFTLGGDLIWSNGGFFGTFTIDVAGIVQLSDVYFKNLGNGITLNANGGASLAGSGDFNISPAAILNTTAGTFNLNSNARITGEGVWNNSGIITKGALSTGLTQIYASLNNNGVFNIDNGQLELRGSTLVHTGQFTGAGQLTIIGGVHDFNAGASMSVANVIFTGGTTTFNTGSFYTSPNFDVRGGTVTLNVASLNNMNTVNVSGGTLTSNTDFAVVTDVTLSLGEIRGTGNITIAGDLIWDGGAIRGASTIDVAGVVLFNVDNSNTLADSRVLNANGGGNLTGLSGLFDIRNNAIFNTTAGVFILDSDANISGNGGLWNNTSTITKGASSTGLTRITVDFDNNGVVNIDNGQLELRGNGIHTGQFNVAALATLDFSLGTQVLGATRNITGTGNVQFTGGTVNFVENRTTDSATTDTFIADISSITIGSIAQPVNGLVSLLGNDITYNPQGYSGSENFSYVVNGTTTGTATATINYTISQAGNTLPTGNVVITGVITEDQILIADTATIADADGLGTFSYQWLRDGLVIAGASGPNYTLGDADVGSLMSVQVTFTDGQGTTELLTSTQTTTVVNVNDTPIGQPTILGTVSENNTLTAFTRLADTPAITDADGLGIFSFQWLRDGVVISGATGVNYTLGDADVNALMSVQVSYIDGQGTAEIVTSDQTLAVTGVNDIPTGQPVISGTVSEGNVLTVDTASITDPDGLGTFSYQWLRDGVVITGALANTYTLTNADVGSQISVQVDYTDGQGYAETLTSVATTSVINVNNNPVGNVTITGAATEDQTLTADTSGIIDADGLGTFSYQWLRDEASITAATGSTFILTDADVNTLISVEVSYIDGQSTVETLTSAPIRVAGINDTPTGNIVINGAVLVGQTLSVDVTSIADADGLGPLSYQWFAFDTMITGATNSTYTLTNLDIGSEVRVQVTYTDGQGTVELFSSAATLPVGFINSNPAGNVLINGIVTEDQTLTVDITTITDTDGLGAFSYQWLRDGIAIPGATASTYALGDADVNALMSVQVTYTDGQGTTESLTSAQTTTVTGINDIPTGQPVISGTAREGSSLTVDTSSIADVDGLGTYSYQWFHSGVCSNNVAISGATTGTYTLVSTDVGNEVYVQISYTDGQGNNETLTSGLTATITANANANNNPAGNVVITGAATEDQTLIADITTISDADGLGAFSYQWLRDGSVITGATGSTYTLGDADVNALMSIQVSYTDGLGTTESLTSSQTTPVSNINDSPTGNVVINGIATAGQSLTADITTIADADGLGVFSYQWLRNGTDITGATNASYTLDNTDSGNQISVQVRYTDGQGMVELLTSNQTAPVANSNSAPTAIQLTNSTADENAIAAIIGDLSTVDVDAGDTFSYTVNDIRFEVVSGQLKLTTGQSLDYENESTVDIVVTSTDSGGLFTSQAFTINVNDLNDQAPVFTSAANNNIVENNSSAVTLAAVDPEGDSLTFRISGGDDAALFTLNGNQLSFNNNPDYEIPSDLDGDNSYELSITADDGNGNTSTQNIVITVVNGNDAPVVNTAPEDQQTNDGNFFSYQLSSTTFIDVDGTALTYTANLSDGNPLPAWLVFDPVTLSLTGNPGNSDIGSYQVRVTASDGNKNVSVDFDIVVQTNTPPDVDSNASLDLELQAGQSVPVDKSILNIIDPDTPASDIVYTVTKQPENGAFLINGVQVNSFTQADINTGKVEFQHNGLSIATGFALFAVNDGTNPSFNFRMDTNVEIFTYIDPASITTPAVPGNAQREQVVENINNRSDNNV
ncbi:MAG: DUF4347 domain-containing protein, partial [Gammaproteobacteria bacterium]|nr:DUF4347 domain-containing protein [Gammaproteobacteria bacterium]